MTDRTAMMKEVRRGSIVAGRVHVLLAPWLTQMRVRDFRLHGFITGHAAQRLYDPTVHD